MLRPLIIGFAACLSTGCAAEPEVIEIAPEPPALELTGRVVDKADVLSDEFELQLSAKLEQLEKETLVQLVVATTPDLKGRNIADYTRDLANAWGVGDAERDDGLVLLVAPDDRKVRIAVGYGLEETVTNEEASDIIQQSILPRFRESDFEEGIDAGVGGLVDQVTPEEMREAA
ncbi:MAG: TPM domain-containing protein [Pseudomonadota bacterium]